MMKKRIIDRQREFFNTGETFSYEYRKEALERLKESVKKHETEIAAAQKKDLGKSTTES